MNLIRHYAEPKKLFLTWQAPEALGVRTRWAIGELTMNTSEATFGYIEDPMFQELNGKPLEYVRQLGFVGYPAFNPKRRLHHDSVLEAFTRRLPHRSRSDIDRYRSHFRIAPELEASTMMMLALTEAKLPSDGFALVDPFDDHAAQREFLLEISGYRYYAHGCSLDVAIGSDVEFCLEPTNPVDPLAVKIVWNSKTAGYVNRFQVQAFRSWMRDGRVRGVVEKLNGEPGKPKAFIFVTVSPIREQAAA